MFGKIPWNKGLETNTESENPFFNKTHSDETKKIMSEKWSNRILLTCPHCDKQSKNKGNMGRYHFDNCKSKLGNEGKTFKDEIVVCPHCGKSGGLKRMKQVHFDNCKFKK